ncbi:crotonobetainyl-CoA:carnitine CoA-transferase CaiB-like acyl-CoA transferase [Lipingzhangella halophila]|uniref:Crotonobetainyl-CoA:carnitine CoA-transferase CaiB-like acyl-CoA transferase n=1 Tax=Lipingzhangella halophila TaxID=1783352 RepID=A0A7W7RPL0_9ACTN|nr:CoA transferase [Lipingzhangella halophila]MBB4935303.1 crotonobetainyl-CoA:carnitine CoA-transferase CaiB-like acyl-CoA transferase [Lipingzhangella halophila]
MSETGLPLDGVRVLDLSTLLPGPMATLLLAEAGAEVTKVERPGRGDEMRGYQPRLGEDSANFVLLNRGKGSVTMDLRDPATRDALLDRARDTDVWVEQNRPGVMDRLGLGYADVSAVNPAIVYCSITGYGQHGPDAGRAGHDLNYLAESGLLGDAVDRNGAPHLPPTVIADIAGGSYPAVLNILLALMRRDRTGRGVHLDISMTHSLQTLAYSAVATRAGSGSWPEAGRGLLTGGSPRYAIYRTADDRFLAAAPLEQRFWERFAALVGLPAGDQDETGREQEVLDEVARLVRARTAAEWERTFAGEDVCCSVVATFAEAEDAQRLRSDPEYRVAGAGGPDAPALGVPLAPELRHAPGTRRAPAFSDPAPPERPA